MLPGSREVQASGPVKEDTVIGPKIAAVERRKAGVPVTTARGAPSRDAWLTEQGAAPAGEPRKLVPGGRAAVRTR